jgi:C-terminal processing protease CtpA/Prc
MLAELRDLHVWIERPDGETEHPYVSRYRGNYDHADLFRRLRDVKRFDPLGRIGRTEEGFGVVVIRQLPRQTDPVYLHLAAAVRQMFDASGLIVDLRANGGGAEGGAAKIAGLFTSQRVLYARSQVRDGPQSDALRENPPRYLEPAGGEAYPGPVVCLIGPGCVSSGEGFALMMKSLPHVTLVGQPTRGASGNPQPVWLSNGVGVWFSRWISMEPDGTPIEGRGVQPHVRLDHSGPGDTTFDEAVRILREKTER